jgi:hypothetical protein
MGGEGNATRWVSVGQEARRDGGRAQDEEMKGTLLQLAEEWEGEEAVEG